MLIPMAFLVILGLLLSAACRRDRRRVGEEITLGVKRVPVCEAVIRRPGGTPEVVASRDDEFRNITLNTCVFGSSSGLSDVCSGICDYTGPEGVPDGVRTCHDVEEYWLRKVFEIVTAGRDDSTSRFYDPTGEGWCVSSYSCCGMEAEEEIPPGEIRGACTGSESLARRFCPECLEPVTEMKFPSCVPVAPGPDDPCCDVVEPPGDRLNFPPTPVGRISPPQNVIIQNCGEAVLEVSVDGTSIRETRTGPPSDDFRISLDDDDVDDCARRTLVESFAMIGHLRGPRENCEIQVQFTPTMPGPRRAVLVIRSNDPRSPKYISLDGEGMTPPPVPPDITVDPLVVTFPDTPVGTTSSAMSVQVRNDGEGLLLLDAIGIDRASGHPDDFLLDLTDCSPGRGLRTGEPSCTINVQFRPTAAGPRSAVLQIPSNDPDEDPVRVDLRGNGIVSLIAVEPVSLSFACPSFIFGCTAEQRVRIRNTGTRTLVIMNIQLTGLPAGSLDFVGRVVSTGRRLPSGSISVPPGGMIEVGITACRGTVNTADLVITSDDPVMPRVTVGLTKRCP
jgi:hypothetical protein